VSSWHRLRHRVVRMRLRAVRGRRALARAFASSVAAVVRAGTWLAAGARRVVHASQPLARAAMLVAVLSVLVATGAYAAARFHRDFGGGQATVDARTWAARTLSYSGSTCESCHAEQVATQAEWPHDGVPCETCHGPQGDHPQTEAGIVSMVIPASGICLTCHATTAGRPADFPVIDPQAHYSSGACLRCHDPHVVVAAAPPDVTHPLDRLPACTTCHAPNGLTRLPSGHEMVSDAVCLSCHKVPSDD
jgi:hypothetical protein